MDLNKVPVLVTGATGFIGRHLISALAREKADISVISRNKTALNGKIKTYVGDLGDRAFINGVVKESNPKKIFHLAAVVDPSRDINLLEEIFKVNFFGTVNLLDCLKNTDYDSFVFSSTAEVYGNSIVPFRENMMPHPLSPYSLSKASAEIFCNMLWKNNGYPITVLRLFMVYGPGQKADRFLPQILTALLKNKEFSMTKGKQKRDYVFIEDAVEALIKSSLAKRSSGETINICSGKQYPLKMIAEKIAAMLDKRHLIKYSLPYRKNEQWDYCGDGIKARKILKWGPKTDLDAGLEKTIRWYKHNA